MMRINCFIPYESPLQVQRTIRNLQDTGCVAKIYLLAMRDVPPLDGCEMLRVGSLASTAAMRLVARHADTVYTLIYMKYTTLEWRPYALERFLRIADDSNAAILYADHCQWRGGQQILCPLIDYRKGSLRDDFDFGSVLLYRSDVLKAAVGSMDADYRFAGLYDLRLRTSREGEAFHVNECLYAEVEEDLRTSGEKQFDYVNPQNAGVQKEMEAACTNHLKAVGAYVEPMEEDLDFSAGSFPCEASVIIPVRNRVATIGDAVRSALSQRSSFRYNVIVIDNYSTDGTAELLETFRSDERFIYLMPTRTGLGIGGCWNMGIHHPACGKFAIQLDSDDLYSGEHALQTIVDAFYEQRCAMVVGTYRMTDFEKNEISPGVIAHREWTQENGHNNLLRVNGLGAPRAFYTPLLRELNFPDVSYGEDYAVGLAMSRRHRIGRIYDVIYLCRRWAGNSDACLDMAGVNKHNAYKDMLRTLELEARITLNKRKEGYGEAR